MDVGEHIQNVEQQSVVDTTTLESAILQENFALGADKMERFDISHLHIITIL